MTTTDHALDSLLVSRRPCGCVELAMWDRETTTPKQRREFYRTAADRGIPVQQVTRAEFQATPWECPEHEAERKARPKRGKLLK